MIEALHLGGDVRRLDEQTDPLGGCVTTRDGRVLPFDDWYRERFGEEPSRSNISRRLAARIDRMPAEEAIAFGNALIEEMDRERRG
jgi:hypothetical protein